MTPPWSEGRAAVDPRGVVMSWAVFVSGLKGACKGAACKGADDLITFYLATGLRKVQVAVFGLGDTRLVAALVVTTATVGKRARWTEANIRLFRAFRPSIKLLQSSPAVKVEPLAVLLLSIHTYCIFPSWFFASSRPDRY